MDWGGGDEKGDEGKWMGVGGGWDEEIPKLKTNVISAASEKKQCLLFAEACLAACSRWWVQHCGMTLLLNVFNLCSHQIQRRSVCTEERGRGNRVDCLGEIFPVDTAVRFYGHTRTEVSSMLLVHHRRFEEETTSP